MSSPIQIKTLTSGISSGSSGPFDVVGFNTAAGEPTYAEGNLFWDDAHKTLAIQTSADTTLQIGQESVAYCRNDELVTVTDGQVVRLSGAQGDRPAVLLAQADSETTSYAFGVATQDIESLGNGFVTVRGIVHGFDTRPFTEGDILYLSDSVAGGITNVEPLSPSHTCIIGRALNSKQNGSIYVTISNGHELEEAHDVLITDITDKDGLVWDDVQGLWVNRPVLLPDGSVPMDVGYAPSTNRDLMTSEFASILLPTSYTINTGTLNNDTTNSFETFRYRVGFGTLSIAPVGGIIDVEFLFDDVTIRHQGLLYELYEYSQGHITSIWNWGTSSWDAISIPSISLDNPGQGYNPVYCGISDMSAYVSSGQTKIQFTSTGTSMSINTVHLSRMMWDRLMVGEPSVIPVGNVGSAIIGGNNAPSYVVRYNTMEAKLLSTLSFFVPITSNIPTGFGSEVGAISNTTDPIEFSGSSVWELTPDATNGLNVEMVFGATQAAEYLIAGASQFSIIFTLTNTVGDLAVEFSTNGGSSWDAYGTIPTKAVRSFVYVADFSLGNLYTGGIYSGYEMLLRITSANTTGTVVIDWIHAVPYGNVFGLKWTPHKLLVGQDEPCHPETALIISDNTVNDATVSAHGFLPKLSGNSTDVLFGDGTFGPFPTELTSDELAAVNNASAPDGTNYFATMADIPDLTAIKKDIIGVVIDGGGSVITTGSKGYREVPAAMTVTGWTILGDASGTLSVDVKSCTYANFPTTSSIAGSEKPALSSAQKNQDQSLTTWTTSLAAGDILEFVVDGSPATVTKAWVFLEVTY